MADNQNLQSMAENLFEAMDIITSKRLSALEYDKTLVCTIESVEDAKNCPVGAVSGEKKEKHVIDTSKCIKCGTCIEKCKKGAIVKR